MPNEARHGRFIPTGRSLASAIRPLLTAEGRRWRAAYNRGQLANVSATWEEALASIVTPLIQTHYEAGIKIAARELRRKRSRERRKSSDDWLPSYRVLQGVSQTVEFAAQRLALDLAGGISESLRIQMRDTLGTGLAGGFTPPEIAEAFERYFGPKRANVIAVTEASRAQHAGEMDTYRSVGITQHSWLASADACELCKGLDGTIVDIGEPFHVHQAGREAYRKVLHPPAHPVCKCSVIPVIG